MNAQLLKSPVLWFTCMSSVVLMLFGGCLGIGQRDMQPTLYYTLEPVEFVALPGASGEEKMVVGLERIVLPDYLNRREMVVRTGRNEMRYTDRHLWAERPSDSFQRILALNVERQTAIPTEIHSLPWPDHTQPKWVINLGVEAFEGQESPDTELLLQVSWTIRTSDEDGPVVEGHYAGKGLSWSKGDYASLAGGLSEGLVHLGRLIAKDLEQMVEK